MNKRVMNKLALSALVLGSVMAVTAAQAEPLALTTAQMDTVTASGKGFASFDGNIYARKDFDTDIDFDKRARVDSKVDAKGYLADANAVSNCAGGRGCTAETFTGADTNAFDGTGTAASHSVSASN